jgi:D-3-phosphoglycerate dehydrogenase
MYKIKTMNKISPLGLGELPARLYETGDSFADETAILVRSAALHDYAFPPELLAIARAGAGVNNIPLDKCAEAGIVVFNTPGANANAVKELAVCALLLTARNISGGIDWVRAQAQNGEVADGVEKGKAQFAGSEIAGKTLGVVGLGAIGLLVAKAAAALGMTVVGYDPFYPADGKVKTVPSLDELYARADYISLHLPMTAETKGSLNAAAFGKMKPGVRIVNLARGELMNNGDLLAALDSGQVAAYATDFPVSALAKHPQVVPIPHLGASTEESEDNCAVMAAREIDGYLTGGNLVNAVNFPSVTLAWDAPVRAVVLHRAELTAKTIAERAGGVSAFAGKVKGNYAATLLNTDAAPAGLSELDGVLRVRILTRA